MERVLQSDQLAAILSVDKEHIIEPVASPQPFRFQPRLTLVVDYDEYTNFLSTIPGDWEYLYRTPTTAKAEDMQKCFLMDVLRAVLCELFFASAVSRETGFPMLPTHIRHRFSNAPSQPLPSTWHRKEPVVRALSESIGCTNIRAQSYAADWAYACALCELAQSPKEINFIT